MISHKEIIESDIVGKLHNNGVLGAIETLDEHIKSARKHTKKITKSVKEFDMSLVNKAFDNYISAFRIIISRMKLAKSCFNGAYRRGRK